VLDGEEGRITIDVLNEEEGMMAYKRFDTLTMELKPYIKHHESVNRYISMLIKHGDRSNRQESSILADLI
jgi:hypothetical protein